MLAGHPLTGYASGIRRRAGGGTAGTAGAAVTFGHLSGFN